MWYWNEQTELGRYCSVGSMLVTLHLSLDRVAVIQHIYDASPSQAVQTLASLIQ